MFQKSFGKFWISHQIFLITLHIFRSSLVSARDRRCINTRPLKFSPAVSDSVGNCGLPTNADGLYPSVSRSVIVLIVTFPVNIYATLCEMSTNM
jgi:hypothetical protein